MHPSPESPQPGEFAESPTVPWNPPVTKPFESWSSGLWQRFRGLSLLNWKKKES